MYLIGTIASSILKVSDTGAMYPLQAITVGPSGASSITFNNIPSTYTHLQIRGIVRSDNASSTAGFIMRANGDSGSNYSAHNLGGSGAAAQSNAYVSNTYMYPGPAMPAASATSNAFGTMVIDILDYANTNRYKTMKSLSAFDANGSGEIYLSSSAWRNTNAITSLVLSFSSNCVQYSSFGLYGIKVA